MSCPEVFIHSRQSIKPRCLLGERLAKCCEAVKGGSSTLPGGAIVKISWKLRDKAHQQLFETPWGWSCHYEFEFISSFKAAHITTFLTHSQCGILKVWHRNSFKKRAWNNIIFFIVTFKIKDEELISLNHICTLFKTFPHCVIYVVILNCPEQV